jgi:hypothetical protein
MAEFKVTFHKCIQDSQDYGSDDEHMVSRVFFSLDIDGTRAGDFSADLKQVVGGDFETGDIEVSPPYGFDGPFNHHGFGEAATKYFRSLVGSKGSVIRIVGGGNIRMRNNTYVKDVEFNF